MDNTIEFVNWDYQEVCREHARRMVKDGIPLSVRICRTFGRMENTQTKFDMTTGLLDVMTANGFGIEKLACIPIEPSKGVIIHPIKAGIFISNYKGFASNMLRYNKLCTQVANWEQLRVVGYFGAQKKADGRVYVSYSFCQPEDYVFSRYWFDKKVSLTLLHNKLRHQRLLDVDECENRQVVAAFGDADWMHDPVIPYFDKTTGIDCIYIFNRTFTQQYNHFVDRCISYFKLKED